MRLFSILTLTALLGVLSACGGEGGSAGMVTQGSNCDRLGEKRCGLGPEGDSAVMLCSAATTEGSQWVVQLLCADECIDGGCISLGGDSLPLDAAQDTVGIKDQASPDAPTADQLGDSGPTCAAFMEPCATNDNCCSPGLCVKGPDGMVCTTTCWEDCPLGWLCQEQGMPPDSQWVCLFQEDLLCVKECLEDEDCKSGLDLCLPIGLEDKRYCSRNCADKTCPDGFTCANIPVDGGTARQCVPDAGACECLGKTAEDYISDPNNCGACGVVCAFDNALPLCVSEECARGECLPGFVDLNGDDLDGCEYPLRLRLGPGPARPRGRGRGLRRHGWQRPGRRLRVLLHGHGHGQQQGQHHPARAQH